MVEPPDFKTTIAVEKGFAAFAKLGDPSGKEITIAHADQWLKECGIVGGKISTMDTAMIYQKLSVKKMNYDKFMEFLDTLAKENKGDLNSFKKKLATVIEPGGGGKAGGSKGKGKK